VTGVFATYIVITVPLLTYLFFVMIRGLPRLLATTWRSLFTQTAAFSAAQSHGDLLTMSLAGIQMFLLTLPALGTVYVIYSLIRTPVGAVWSWSKPTATRRMAGALSAAAATALLGIVWAPQLRDLTGRRAILMRPNGADRTPGTPTGALLAQTREATGRAQTLRADLEGSLGSEQFTGTAVLKRPNLARIHVRGTGGFGEFLVVSDGTNLFVYFPGDNRYTQSSPGPEGRNIHAFVAEPIDDFFRPDRIGLTPAGGRSRYAGTQAAEHGEYEVVEMVETRPAMRRTRLFISPKDRLIHRVVIPSNHESAAEANAWVDLKNIRTSEPVDDAIFRWSLPPNARPLQLPSGVALPLGNGVTR
jgi:outer membrane lipoprotein-sorting protein